MRILAQCMEIIKLFRSYAKLLQVLAGIQLTFSGVVCIYYGDIYAYTRVVENIIDTFAKPKKNGFALAVINRILDKEHEITVDLSQYKGLKLLKDVMLGEAYKA